MTTEQLPELKPCPFCQRIVKATRIVGFGKDEYLVGCDNRDCPASDISCYPERWNTRADLSQPQQGRKRRIFLDKEAVRLAETQGLALAIYEALAANDDINTWHKDRLLPMIESIVNDHARTQPVPAIRTEEGDDNAE